MSTYVQCNELVPPEHRVDDDSPRDINSIAFSPRGDLIATGATDHIVRIWSSIRLLSYTLQGHKSSVECVTFSPDGNHLASASYDKNVIIWDLLTHERTREFESGSRLISITFSPTGNLAVPSGDTRVCIYDPSSGECLRSLEHGPAIESVIFSPDGKRLVSVSNDIVKVWDTSNWECLSKSTQIGEGLSVAMSPSGRLLALTNEHKTFIASQDGNDYVGKYSLKAGNCMTFLPGDKFISVSGGWMQICDTETGECLQESRLELPHPIVIASSSDGKLIAAGSSDGRIILLAASADRTSENDQEIRPSQPALVPFESRPSLITKAAYETEFRNKILSRCRKFVNTQAKDAQKDPMLKSALNAMRNVLDVAALSLTEKTQLEGHESKKRKLID